MTVRAQWATSRPEKKSCALDAIRWQYPRPIPRHEMELSYWFRYGPHCVFWFQWADWDPTTRDLILHICIEPEYRGSVYARRWIYAVDILGEILGADRLIAPGPIGEAPVKRFLERMGWKECDGAMVKTLERRFDGETPAETEETQSQPERHRGGGG